MIPESLSDLNGLFVESNKYCPFEKGTSDENEIREVLSKTTVCTLANEPEPRDNVVSSGRSNYPINHQDTY